MRKKLLLIAAVLFSLAANAQNDSNMLNHMSAGLNLGTPGIGLDVAMPIGNYVQVRAGVSLVPNITVNTDLDIDIDVNSEVESQGYSIPKQIAVEGKVGFTNGKVLFDVYPFKGSSFFVTAGAYFGSSKVVKATNAEDGALSSITRFNNDVDAGKFPSDKVSKIGLLLGDYLLVPDKDGNVEACIKTSGFKPYLGLGFGRAVPKKRIGCMVELGCQFWGSPKVYCFDKELTAKDVDGEGGDILKTLSKVTVYPVVNFRICGRLF